MPVVSQFIVKPEAGIVLIPGTIVYFFLVYLSGILLSILVSGISHYVCLEIHPHGV